MKKLYLTLLTLLVTITCMSQTIGEAFYVYRNDGMINTFLRNEVDSMTYSCYDTDSILYDEIVTQVVYTHDSIYRIPLAAVDSIGFVTPETKYHSGVIKLEGTIRDYIIGSDSLKIFFRLDTPSDILPKIGDKLVTTELSEIFIGGFLGQVEEIEHKENSIALHCSTIGLEDVFEYFYYSEVRDFQDTPNSSRAFGWEWDNSYAPNPLVFSFTNFLKTGFQSVDTPFKVSPQFDVTIAPFFHGKGSIIVHPIKGVVVSMDIWQRTTFTEDLGISGEASFSHDFTPGGIPVFSILPFVWIYGEVGLFFKIGGRLALEEHWKQSLSYKIHYENSYLPALGMFTSIPKFTISDVDLTTERKGQFMFEGSAASGVYGEIGVALLAKKLLSSGFRFEAGVEVGGEIMLYNSDKDVAQYSTSVYEKLRATELYVKPFCKVGLEARMLSVGKGDINIFERKWTGDTFKLVPSFANTTLIREPSDPHLLKASTKAFARSLFPCDLGFRLIKEGSDTSTDCNNLLHYANTPQTYEHYFTIEDFGKKYTLYPIVELLGLGINMRALPSAELNPPEPYYVWDEANKTAKYYYDGMYDSRGGWKINEYSHNVRNSSLKVIFDESFSNYYPKYFFSFNRCSELQSIENLKYLKTDSITSMSGMFYECKSLTSLNLSNFNTANVKKMSNMFGDCKSLTTLDLRSFNTSNVTTMSAMFVRCSSLRTLNLSSFNTTNVTSMSNMFSDCKSLTTLDLSSFNTSNVKGMPYMFRYCSSLKNLDLRNFNTANVKEMDGMFSKCSSLKNLDLSNFNTSNVTTMSSMFSECSSLTSLDLTSFDTSNVKDMIEMFHWCKSLTSLDLTSFDTSNVIDMYFMFSNCSSLETIYAENWNCPSGAFDYIFNGCHNLTGGMGTKIGENIYGHDNNGNPLYYNCPSNSRAAHIDGGKDWPGLFTEK